jgi:hypothetical protein
MVEPDCNNGVDRLSLYNTVVFPYTDQPVSVGVYNRIGIPSCSLSGERPWLQSGVLLIQPLISKVGEINSPI